MAGPGSGKTRVLVKRFLWLAASGTPPERILTITYTEKAANEIKSRLTAKRDMPAELRAGYERAPVSTVHGFCARLLRERALDAGLDPDFRVLDELEAATLQFEAMDAVLDEWAAARTAEFRALLDAWGCYDPSRHLLLAHEALRVNGDVEEQLRAMPPFDITPTLDELARQGRELVRNASRSTANRRAKLEQVERWLASRVEMDAMAWVLAFGLNLRGMDDGAKAYAEQMRELQEKSAALLIGAMHEPQRRVLADILLAFDAEYGRRKRAGAGLDFHDLETYTLAMLEDESTRKQIAARFDAILMDELQDTNPIQWRILERLRRPERFFAVGDVNQSIYGFRHAEPKLFEQYQREVETAGGVLDRLEMNYRSRPEIIAAAVRVAEECEGIRKQDLRPREKPFPAKPVASVEVQRFEPSPDGDETSEADWIAYRLEQLQQELRVGDPPRPARWSDMAVLARTSSPFGELESALAARGIPCTVRRGRNFFEQQEVIDLTNVLRVLAAPGDEIALYALLRSPFFGVADQELYAARLRGEFPPPGAAAAVRRLLDAREAAPADRLLARFIDERGYLDNLAPTARANVEKFLHLLRRWQAAAPGDGREWLRNLEALSAAGSEPNAVAPEDEDAVKLMTMHSAKGLEFPVVLLAGLQRGTNGGKEPLAWSVDQGLGASWRLPGDPKPKPDAALAAIRERQQQRELLESHRLLYVAMTRAEEHLILSWTKPRQGQPDWVKRIERAFDLDWDHGPPTTGFGGMLKVSALVGRPPAPEAVPGARAAEWADVVVEPGSPEPEASPVVAVTQLVHFAECPRRHYLTHVARWPEPPRAGSTGARELGEEVHRLLARLPVEHPSAEALRLRDAFLRSPLGQELEQASRVEREFDFLFELDGTLLRGVIDLWFEAGGAVTLVDYKTGAAIAEQTMRAYLDQLGFYALALERLTGELPARAALFLLHQDRTVEAPLGEHTRARCQELLKSWADAEREGNYPMQPGDRCAWCPYEGSACAGRAMPEFPGSRP